MINLEGVMACFPGHVTVELANGTRVAMRDLRVGDEVLAGGGAYSKVFLFTHADSEARSQFIRLETRDGKVLLLTASHYVWRNGHFAQARTVMVGDRLLLSPDSRTRSATYGFVTSVSTVQARGLYNPHTVRGDIVVEGILTSCYTSTVVPDAAHSLLSALRALHQIGLHPFSRTLTNIRRVAAMALRLTQTLTGENNASQMKATRT